MLLNTVGAVAARLHVSPWTVRRMIADGELQAIRLRGRILRVSEEELERFVTAQTHSPAPPRATPTTPTTTPSGEEIHP